MKICVTLGDNASCLCVQLGGWGKQDGGSGNGAFNRLLQVGLAVGGGRTKMRDEADCLNPIFNPAEVRFRK